MAQVSLFVQRETTAKFRGVDEANDQVLLSQIEGTRPLRSLWADTAATGVNLATGTNVATVQVGNASSTVSIPGALAVAGTTTTISTTHLLVNDVMTLFANGAATGDEAGIAFERGSSGDDATFFWNEVNQRFELGLFDTVGGTVAPTGALGVGNNVPIAVSELSIIHPTDPAIYSNGALTIATSSALMRLRATGANPIKLETNGLDVDVNVTAQGLLQLSDPDGTVGARIDLLNLGGTRRGSLQANTNSFDVLRADSATVSFSLANATAPLGPVFRSDGYIAWSASTATGATAGDVRLRRGAAGALEQIDPGAAADSEFRLYNAAGTAWAGFKSSSTNLQINFTGVGRFLLNSGSFLAYNGQTLGTSTYEWSDAYFDGTVYLGETQQVEISESSGYAQVQGANGVALGVVGSNQWLITPTALIPGGPGSEDIGSATAEINDLYMSGQINFGAAQDMSIVPSGAGRLIFRDFTASANARIDLYTSAGVLGTIIQSASSSTGINMGNPGVLQWSNTGAANSGTFDVRLSRAGTGTLALTDATGLVTPVLRVYDTAGTSWWSMLHSGTQAVIGTNTGDIAFQAAGTTYMLLTGVSGHLRPVVDGQQLGLTSKPWDSLTLGAAAYQGLIDVTAAGVFNFRDPAAGAGAVIELLDSAGTNNRVALSANTSTYGAGLSLGSANSVFFSSAAAASGAADIRVARVSAGVLGVTDPNTTQNIEIRAYDATNVDYLAITHNGTEAVLQSNSGAIKAVSPTGVFQIRDQVGTPTVNPSLLLINPTSYGGLSLSGTTNLNFTLNGTTYAALQSAAFRSGTTPIALGTNNQPWSKLILGDGTNEVEVSTIAGQDGVLAVKDPNGVAVPELRVYNAGNSAWVGMECQATNARLTINGADRIVFNSAGVYGVGVLDLGASSSEWQDLYMQGTLFLDTSQTTAIDGAAGVVEVSDPTNANNGTIRAIDATGAKRTTITRGASGGVISIDGVADYLGIGVNDTWQWRFTASGVLEPDASNTRDIGSSSNEVKDLYMQGLLYLNGLQTVALSSSAAGTVTIDDPSNTYDANLKLFNSTGATSFNLGITSGNTIFSSVGTSFQFSASTGRYEFLSSGGSTPKLELYSASNTYYTEMQAATADGRMQIRDASGTNGARLDLINQGGGVNCSVYAFGTTGAVFNGGTGGAFLATAGTLRFVASSAGTGLYGPNSALMAVSHSSQELTALSGASVTTSGLIPAGCILKAVVVRVTTAITGATSFDIGDGTDVDRWGAGIAVALATRTFETDFTADPGGWSASAREVTLTANGSNFTGGAVRIVAFYETYDGPTG